MTSSKGSLALTLAAGASGRRYTTAHLELARGLASRIALALDNARLYADAQRAITARDATLALVSHDLRTPLGVILLRAQLLQQGAADRAPREDLRSLEVIRRAAERMGRLIQDLVDIASIEAGQVAMAHSPQPVASLVEEMLDALRAHAAAKALRLAGELPADDRMEVECDRDRIAQVLANLIGNAIKFTPAGGRIVVRAEPFGAEVRISVADTGPGIAPADLPHVFDRYWQARDTAHLGSGLGLAIAKAIVEVHGGRIWAESQLGAGTTVHFTLPRAAEVRGAIARPAIHEARQDGTVLVVDDDLDARDVLCEVLARHGYAVATAGNGVEALAYLRRASAPALIVLDLAMPVMDGWAFLAEREREPALRAIPVLVMSGQRDATEQVAGFHAGYLAKPIAMDRLLAEVAHAVH